MAQQADGTVYVDTLMDTTGFKAGGKEVEAAARRMAKTVSNIGSNAKASTKKLLDSFTKANRPINGLKENVDSLRQKMESLREQKVTTDEFNEIEKQIKEDTKAMDNLIAKQKAFVDLGGSKKDSAYIEDEKRIEELRNSIKYATAEKEELIKAGGAYTGETIDGTGTEEYGAAVKEYEAAVVNLNQQTMKAQSAFLQLSDKVQSLGGERQRNNEVANSS